MENRNPHYDEENEEERRMIEKPINPSWWRHRQTQQPTQQEQARLDPNHCFLTTALVPQLPLSASIRNRISFPETVPFTRRVIGCPSHSSTTAKEMASPFSLPSLIGHSFPVVPTQVPVRDSPLAFKVKATFPPCDISPFHVPLASAASAVLRKASSRKETIDISLIGRVILV